jgi:hypothetical protein
MPFRRSSAPPQQPPPPQPRKAFTIVTGIGYGSADGSPQFTGHVNAAAVIAGAGSLIDYIGIPAVQVPLAYADGPADVQNKIQAELRALTGDATLICVLLP